MPGKLPGNTKAGAPGAQYSVSGGKKQGDGGGAQESTQVKSSCSVPGMMEVTNEENAIIKSLVNEKTTALRRPHRPGYSTQGRDINMQANYFTLTQTKADIIFHRYSIDIEPVYEEGQPAKKPMGKKARQIVLLMLELPFFEELAGGIVTDCSNLLISSCKLDPTRLQHRIEYLAEGENAGRRPPPKFDIHLRLSANIPELALSDLANFMGTRVADPAYEKKCTMLQTLDVLLSHYMKTSPDFATVGTNKAFAISEKKTTKDLGSGLIGHRGFFLSARPATYRTLVNVNVTHSVFYRQGPLHELMNIYGTGDLVALEKFLKGRRVGTKHLKDESGEAIRKIRTITGLARNTDGQGLAQEDRTEFLREFGACPKEARFMIKDPATDKSRKITIYEFFRTRYQIDANPQLPLVNIGGSSHKLKPIYLPAEACFVLRGQVFRSLLDEAQTKKLTTDFAIRPPSQKKKSIETGLSTMKLHPGSKQMDEFGFKIDPQMVQVCGRMLDAPQMVYREKVCIPAYNGRWNLATESGGRAKTQFLRTENALQEWGWLALTQRGRTQGGRMSPEGAVDAFSTALRSTGIKLEKPRGMRLSFNKVDDGAIRQQFRSWKDAKVTFILVILPSNDAELYRYIKCLGDIQYGINTVCVIGQSNKFYKNDPQYYANVALKVNLKLQGTNHTLNDQSLPVVSEGKTMVVGIDVTHPTGSSAEDAPSIATIVASVDKNLAQWPAVLRIQVQPRQEMVTAAGDMLVTRLRIWSRKNKTLPKNILIYRDGVGESQYGRVVDTELKAMQKRCTSVYKDAQMSQPKFTLVIVGKRHHTRFYHDGKHATKNGNPPCGTLVDRHVTEARAWDFYLQSHHAIQGTARSAHYVVLWDEIFFDHPIQKIRPYTNAGEVLQHLTYSMCFLFGRATSAVSIVPAVYYADIACERTRCYLSREYEGLGEEGTVDNETDAQKFARRERLRLQMQKDITVHPDLVDSMFFI